MKRFLILLALLLPGISLAANPSPPVNMTATVNGTSETLSWTNPAGLGQGTNIYCAVSDAALSALPNTINGGTPTAGGPGSPLLNPASSATLANLPNGPNVCAGTRWDCSVVPCTESAFSAHVSVTIGSTTPVVLTNGIANLTWVAPTANTDGSAITGTITYNVYLGPTATSLVKVTNVPLAALADTISGLANGSTDCFAITALVSAQESAQSSAICGTVPAAVVLTPSPPSGVKLSITLTSQ